MCVYPDCCIKIRREIRFDGDGLLPVIMGMHCLLLTLRRCQDPEFACGAKKWAIADA